MDVDAEKIRFHEQVKALVGRKFKRVRYATIDYFDGKPYWNHGDFHNAELGIELTTDSDEVFNVSWDWKFYSYGLVVRRAKDEELWKEDVVMWDVTLEPHWSLFIGKELIQVTVYWRTTGDEESRSPNYPQDFEFIFTSGHKLWLLAACCDESTKELFGMGDEVTTVFDEDVLRRNNFGAYTPKKELSQTVIIK